MPTVDAANETAGRVDGPSTKLPFWAKIQRFTLEEIHEMAVNIPGKLLM